MTVSPSWGMAWVVIMMATVAQLGLLETNFSNTGLWFSSAVLWLSSFSSTKYLINPNKTLFLNQKYLTISDRNRPKETRAVAHRAVVICGFIGLKLEGFGYCGLFQSQLAPRDFRRLCRWVQANRTNEQ